MSLAFSLLDDSRVNESFAILGLAARWLQQMGRRQRIANITLPVYQQWQTEQANYVITENHRIVGIVTLREEQLDEWPAFQSQGQVNMIRALATHPDHRGKGVGEFAIQEVIKLCENKSAVYLDCVNDLLPTYYAKHGFEVIAQQERTYPNEVSYDIVLMRKQIIGISN